MYNPTTAIETIAWKATKLPIDCQAEQHTKPLSACNSDRNGHKVDEPDSVPQHLYLSGEWLG